MTTWINTPPDFQGLRVTVMGLGRFGGGAASVRFLAERGARVIATDLKREEQLSDVLARLKSLPHVEFHLGRHIESDFRYTDLVVVNPAVSLQHPLLQLAAGNGVPLTSEINLFWMQCPAPIIGVTGTNGKSTTATLIHRLLATSGVKSRLGGNIGHSLLGEVDQITADEHIVLELSSFQLEGLDQIHCSPWIAVVTNFTPNHLERHGSLDRYRRAKQTVLRYQRLDDVAVLNSDDESGDWATSARRSYFGRTGRPDALFDSEGVSISGSGCDRRVEARNSTLRGPHNAANLAAAMLAARAAGADLEDVGSALDGYRGLPHRLQFVAERAGRIFINDSKATTPEAAAAAIGTLRDGAGRLVLLAGGADKQIDLRPFAQQIAGGVSAVSLMGDTARPLAALLDQLSDHHGPLRFCAPSFESAFDWAVRQSRPGDTILLSPGCASYGWFDNFEERGLRFEELVEAWSSTV